jgi:xanthine dehydrogenase/oxidase
LTGEPPLVLANTVFFAIKHAILAARKDAGVDGWFSLDAPATIERIQQACASGANLAG